MALKRHGNALSEEAHLTANSPDLWSFTFFDAIPRTSHFRDCRDVFFSSFRFVVNSKSFNLRISCFALSTQRQTTPALTLEKQIYTDVFKAIISFFVLNNVYSTRSRNINIPFYNRVLSIFPFFNLSKIKLHKPSRYSVHRNAYEREQNYLVTVNSISRIERTTGLDNFILTKKRCWIETKLNSSKLVFSSLILFSF